MPILLFYPGLHEDSRCPGYVTLNKNDPVYRDPKGI
jgi:hypothetical protein